MKGLFINLLQVGEHLCFPCHGRGETDGGKAGAGQYRLHKPGVDQAVFKSVDQPRQEGDGKIMTVLSVQHPPGVQGVGIAEQAVSCLHMINAVVDLVFHFSGEKQCQLNFRMPVPGKRAAFIGREDFMAGMKGKFIGAMGF